MGGSLALRVLALVFLAAVDALDLQRGNLLANRVVELALEPDKGLVFVFQLAVQLGHRHVEQVRQFLQLHRVAVHVLRDGPDAGGRHAGREDQAIAVQNAAAVGWQLQRARKPHLALALEEGVANHLHIGRTGRQHRERDGNPRDNEFAAPDRRFARQQGAGRVADAAAAHGVAPTRRTGVSPLPPEGAELARGGPSLRSTPPTLALALASGSLTYCVMPGVADCICSCCRAIFSTRSGVAWARFSTCSRSNSTSSRRASLLAFSNSPNSWRDSYWVRTKYSALAITASNKTTLTLLMLRSSAPHA
eukprot:Opistho-2@12928